MPFRVWLPFESLGLRRFATAPPRACRDGIYEGHEGEGVAEDDGGNEGHDAHEGVADVEGQEDGTCET